MGKTTRPTISTQTQCEVYFRNHWLCYLCGRPLIFPLAMKLVAEMVEQGHRSPPLAYFNEQWRRDLAPLLDELACSVDHVEAFSKAGVHSEANFAAICARCNARKGAKSKESYLAESTPWRVKGKHGEPKQWDGLTSVFVHLARQTTRRLTPTERAWLRVLESRGRGTKQEK